MSEDAYWTLVVILWPVGIAVIGVIATAIRRKLARHNPDLQAVSEVDDILPILFFAAIFIPFVLCFVGSFLYQ